MKVLVLLLFFTVVKAKIYISNEEPKKEKIVEGQEVSIRSVPWQAQLCQNGLQICGAAIIASHWVVTAAHCTIGSRSHVQTILTGSNKVNKGEIHTIRQIYNHPMYNPTILDHDIALILLNEEIRFSKDQSPVRLPSRPLYDGKEEMIISGFGRLKEHGSYPSTLRLTTVPTVNQALCWYRYEGNGITPNMFCAGNELRDSCDGDSGGPGVINGELVGIISAGMECASNVHFGVYTRVYNYVPWIMYYVWPDTYAAKYRANSFGYAYQ